MYIIFFSKSVYKVVLMFINTFYQVFRHANIKCPVTLAGQNINIRWFLNAIDLSGFPLSRE